MLLALRLARRGYGKTSPNPMVGAVLVKQGKIIGRGWHQGAGKPHAEVEALRDALKHGHNPRGATLYVTLEPCCTHGRTPPCTDAIIEAGLRRVVIGATDPNPQHRGRAFAILNQARLAITHGVLADECARLNEAFNHWIVHRTPFVTVKAAMTLDGKIATASGESKWITGPQARAYGMKLRQGADAILVGINTILADDPSLTVRPAQKHRVRRIVLDSKARIPLSAKVLNDAQAPLTTIVVTRASRKSRLSASSKRVNVLVAPAKSGKIDLRWLVRKLGSENVTSLLVEGGGQVNASFLFQGLAHRVVFFYAPKILGGVDSRLGVAGAGARRLADAINLRNPEWRKLGPDLLFTAQVADS